MNREQLQALSASLIKQAIAKHVPQGTHAYLFGSRARCTHQWRSDFDVWIDANITSAQLSDIHDALDESIVPYPVDIVTTAQCTGVFGELVKKDAIRWI